MNLVYFLKVVVPKQKDKISLRLSLSQMNTGLLEVCVGKETDRLH